MVLASGLNVYALILAGGQGSRMGGADKGLLPAPLGFRLAQGETLIQAQLACLGEWACQPIISANRNLDAYAQFGVPVVTDTQSSDQPDFGGPLCGITAAIEYLQTLKLEHEAVLLWWAVDTLISPDRKSTR